MFASPAAAMQGLSVPDGVAVRTRTMLLTLGLYIGACLGLSWASFIQVFPGAGFTLWNPPPACSLALLLIKGLHYSPAVLVAGVISDGITTGFRAGIVPDLIVNAIIAAGYTLIAACLRRSPGCTLDRPEPRGVAAFFLVASIGIVLIAVSATAALVAMGVVPGSSFAAAARHYWIGDFTGVVGLFPALMSFDSARRRWRELRRSIRLLDSAIFVLGLLLALWLVFGLPGVAEMHFFYLLLLPVIWIGVRQGFALCAMAVLVEQISLISIVTRLDYPISDFISFQILSVTIAATGLLVGAVVTGRERAEIRLRRQQADLDRITRLTTAGALGTAIVHQISQPLATVAAYMHACSRMPLDGTEDRIVVAQTMRKAEAEVLRAGAVIDRLRGVLSNGTVQATPLDLTATAADVVAALGDEALKNGVDVGVEGRIAADVIADQIQIEQVLVNLVRNAIDAAASAAGPVRQVRVRLRALETVAEVSIEDSGPGVAPIIAERMFEVFETTKPQGMGLGLCLSRELAQRHGGRLWWDRGFTPGTRFVLHLPYDCSGDER